MRVRVRVCLIGTSVRTWRVRQVQSARSPAKRDTVSSPACGMQPTVRHPKAMGRRADAVAEKPVGLEGGLARLTGPKWQGPAEGRLDSRLGVSAKRALVGVEY